MHLAAGEAPQQETVHRAEQDIPGRRRFARAFDVIEKPGDLGAREVGVDDQPGARRHQIRVAIVGQSPAEIGGTPVLPDDGVIDRPAGGALPHDGGLALVGDADGGDAAGPVPGLGEDLAANVERRPPDLLGVVFDPTVPREYLGQFALGRSRRPALGVEQDRPGAGGALVDGKNVSVPWHPVSSPSRLFHVNSVTGNFRMLIPTIIEG